MGGVFVKLSDLLVISWVSFVKLRPPFVNLAGPLVNSLRAFVISNASVRQNDRAVREISDAADEFDLSVP
jgi:hypothetical protein